MSSVSVGTSRLDLVEPARAVGIGVDEGGIIGKFLIDFQDFTGDGSVHVAGGLDGFNDGHGVPGGDRGSYFGEVYKDYIGELRLGMVGNTDGADVSVNFDPFMIFGIQQIFWYVVHKIWLYEVRV